MTAYHKSLPAALCILFLAAAQMPTQTAALAQETSEQQYVVAVERIWDRAGHSAFTGLIEHDGQLYCSFREASGHIPGLNGVIRILRSRDRMQWKSVALVAEPHVDLRDPKLSITPDGRIMVTMGASYYEGSERKRIESRVSFSTSDGAEFSQPQKVKFPDEMLTGADWLWRVTWHDGVAWGCVQQVPDREHRSLRLVKSADGITYEPVATLDVPQANETTLRVLGDDTMLAMIRCEGSDSRGRIGLARPPYTEWKLIASNERFGGPDLVQLPGGGWIAGSRDYEGKPTTQVWALDVEAGEFRHLVTLPSGGDTSYPGFVIDKEAGQVYMSYYSSHEGKAAIYLATLRLDALEQATAK